MRYGYASAIVRACLIAFGLALAGSAVAQQQAVSKVVFQVSDGDPGKWNLTLNNAYNLQQELGSDKVVIEIVAYGPGVGMLKRGSSAGERVTKALRDGIGVVACQNTMKTMQLTETDMLPGIGYVPAGVVELMLKQQHGYAYIRP